VDHQLSWWSAESLPSRLGAGIWCHGCPHVFSVQCGIEKLCTG
jgi:hypothetical protein